MIITDHFVYIHTSRTAGTFVNKLILDHVPGAQTLQYHGHLGDLPEKYAHLPVIGLVRNPWDWYVSMFFDYRRKRQYVYQIISESGALSFAATISRFLMLGDRSEQSQRLLGQLVEAAPRNINPRKPARNHTPGLRSADFENYPENTGYYTWLFKLMYESDRQHDIKIGRFEGLRDEMRRLLILSRTPITEGIAIYLRQAEALGSSSRPEKYVGCYSPQLEQLVADKDKFLIDKYGYNFSEGITFPKTKFFNKLGPVNVRDLIDRVEKIPEFLWQAHNKNKPNKLASLNDTRHIVFRFINSIDNIFDFTDQRVLWDKWKDLLLPIMEQAARRLGYENYRFPRVMLARLPAGGEIAPHKDFVASYYIHKIHVPLVTNPATIFHVGEQAEHLPVGEMVEVNNKETHAVQNGGSEDRIHLIFECYNTDDYGKVG